MPVGRHTVRLCSTGNAAISISQHDEPGAAALISRLDEFRARSGLSITASQADKLIALASLVAHWGERMNLSGHRTTEEILDGLVLEALALQGQIRDLVPDDNRQVIVDLGSGAGFPGLPIAIVEPANHVELIDARQRRHHFQRAARRELDLQNVEPRHGRLEELEPTPADLVIAQALAQADQAIEWALAWTKPGGLIVIPGSESAADPRSRAELSTSGRCRYQAPSGRWRSLWWGRRAGLVSSAT